MVLLIHDKNSQITHRELRKAGKKSDIYKTTPPCSVGAHWAERLSSSNYRLEIRVDGVPF